MTFPRYPKYKESHVDFLGAVPEHWFVGRVKHVCSFFTGWTPPTGNAAAYVGENLWANISDLGPRWLSETAKTISDDAIQDSDIRVSKAGDLLFSFKLSIGQVSFAGKDLYTNEAIATFPPSSDLHLPYAYYALPFFLLRNASENIYGAKLLNQELMRSACIALPDVDEQVVIANFLDRETAKIDALVAEQEKLITLLKEKRQTVISQAVTKGLDPTVPMKDSGVEWLGEVPAHWEVMAIKHIVATPITDGPHETPVFLDDGVPFVSAEAVSTGVIDFERIRGFISEEDHARYSLKYKPQRGDIFMIKSGATTGVTAMVETDLDFNIWSPLAVIRAASFMSPGYVLQFMRSLNFQEAVTLNWSFGTQQNIGMGVIENLMMAVPPLAEQEAIVDHLRQLLERFQPLISDATQAIQLLQERRSALISAAVTGQIDVRNNLQP